MYTNGKVAYISNETLSAWNLWYKLTLGLTFSGFATAYKIYNPISYCEVNDILWCMHQWELTFAISVLLNTTVQVTKLQI